MLDRQSNTYSWNKPRERVAGPARRPPYTSSVNSHPDKHRPLQKHVATKNHRRTLKQKILAPIAALAIIGFTGTVIHESRLFDATPATAAASATHHSETPSFTPTPTSGGDGPAPPPKPDVPKPILQPPEKPGPNEYSTNYGQTIVIYEQDTDRPMRIITSSGIDDISQQTAELRDKAIKSGEPQFINQVGLGLTSTDAITTPKEHSTSDHPILTEKPADTLSDSELSQHGVKIVQSADGTNLHLRQSIFDKGGMLENFDAKASGELTIVLLPGAGGSDLKTTDPRYQPYLSEIKAIPTHAEGIYFAPFTQGNTTGKSLIFVFTGYSLIPKERTLLVMAQPDGTFRNIAGEEQTYDTFGSKLTPTMPSPDQLSPTNNSIRLKSGYLWDHPNLGTKLRHEIAHFRQFLAGKILRNKLPTPEADAAYDQSIETGADQGVMDTLIDAWRALQQGSDKGYPLVFERDGQFYQSATPDNKAAI